jgi:hypothetical protein
MHTVINPHILATVIRDTVSSSPVALSYRYDSPISYGKDGYAGLAWFGWRPIRTGMKGTPTTEGAHPETTGEPAPFWYW